jgi:hypothetical protein
MSSCEYRNDHGSGVSFLPESANLVIRIFLVICRT